MVVEVDVSSSSSYDEKEIFEPKRVPFVKKKVDELEDSRSYSSSSDSSTSSSVRTCSDDISINEVIPLSASKTISNPYNRSTRCIPKFILSAASSEILETPTKSETFSRHDDELTTIIDVTPTRPPDRYPNGNIVTLQSSMISEKTRTGESLPSNVFLENEEDCSWLDSAETDDIPRKEILDPGKACIICPIDDNSSSSGKGTTNLSPELDQGYIFHHKNQHDIPAPAIESLPFRRYRVSEVDHSLYAPLPYREKPKPLVHYLTTQNRPKHVRKNLHVGQFFDSPVNLIWKSKFECFNHLQSEVANVLAYTNDNIVVSAPTGAGKTCLFEMAMAKLFTVALQTNGRKQNGISQQLSKHRKIVYIAPSKALCDERFEDWSCRFADMHMGIQCAMITGDAEPGDCYRDMTTAHVILTTPEKWDSITRRWTENFFLIASVKLLLIDEVHLLGDQSRGCCLESVVCRMKTIYQATQNIQPTHEQIHSSSYSNTTPEAITSLLRIVAVSATLPNISDIATFLDANETFAFDASFRPVPLTIHTLGFYGNDKNHFLFNKNLNNRVPDLIHRFSKGKPTIIFCHTKKECELLASELSLAPGIGRQCDRGSIAAAGQTRIKCLQKVLYRGVGYHHAGLDTSDRKIVERAFGDCINVLCATSTLAMGVNLPAHLVIIKGTLTWRGAVEGYSEIDSGTLLQMMGRAGRPGFDTEGTAVIMTDEASKLRYDRLSGGLEVVESQMPAKLLACLNSEVSQQVIKSFTDAMNWIKGTFFFVRARSNPVAYGLGSEPGSLELAFMKIVGESLRELDDDRFISVNKGNGTISPLTGSVVMSSHLVAYAAMKKIVALPFDTTQSSLILAIAEFEGLHRPVRRSEKKILNELHKSIRYKLDGPVSKVRVQHPWQKAFVLLQTAVGRHHLEEFTLRQEMSMMVDFAVRMLVAIEEFSVEGSMHGQVALQSLRLRRCFSASLWGIDDGVLNQLTGVGAETTAKLRINKILTFADVLAANAAEIERASGKSPPFGKGLLSAVDKIMRNTLQLSASIHAKEQQLICTLSRRSFPGISLVNDSLTTCDEDVVKYSLIAYIDKPGGSLQHLSRVHLDREYKCSLPVIYGKVYVSLVANLVGLDEKVVLIGNECPTPPANELSNNSHGLKGPNRKEELRTALCLEPRSRDVRIQRRTNDVTATTHASVKAKDWTCHLPLSSSIEDSQSRFQLGPFAGITSASAVTPSSQPNIGETRWCSPRKVSTSEQRASFRSSVLPRSAQSKRLKKAHQNQWNMEKQVQQTFQQSAFVTEKENPFSRFKFDPNNAESNLEDLTTSSHIQQYEAQGIIPREILAQLPPRQRMNVGVGAIATRNKIRISRFGSTRARRHRNMQTIPNEDLLRMKAEEQTRLCFATEPNTVPVSSYAAQFRSFPVHLQMSQSPHSYLYPSDRLCSRQYINRDELRHDDMHASSQGLSVLESPLNRDRILENSWCDFEYSCPNAVSHFDGHQTNTQQSQWSQPAKVDPYFPIPGNRWDSLSPRMETPSQGQTQQTYHWPLYADEPIGLPRNQQRVEVVFGDQSMDDDETLLRDAFF